ncbi:hypothetical protein Athai_41100 [Actinocatenispora thailandica]|uniref:Abortive infection protein n=1 Tax=Actinocatenispora thailandica TaxID=227318 RepID=A0A7R7HXV6_9ACTN|nr:hypothetical protein [Actinocatenispora thailandica]BCJ36607.1 hypothetical protein Athai_41100 [Actinocatenispora thailandica]
MRAKGICYDTGFLDVDRGTSSRLHLDADLVRRELTIIRDDLHCTAVQVVGGDPDRLELTARCAAELGLEVWFSPYPLELAPGPIRELLLDCAHRAERLRAAGAQVVFVAGVELTMLNRGFLDGDTVADRLRYLFADPDRRPARIAEVRDRFERFLRDLVPAVRAAFHGRVTYAAIQYEGVDWDRFDIVTVELIRSAEVADRFRDGVRTLVAQPKPLAITGFGTATWRGSGDVAARSMQVLASDPATGALRLTEALERDEAGQAEYLRELLEVFDAEGVDSTFVHLFALDNLPHRPDGDPRDDLDLASLGVVKVLADGSGHAYPGLPWEPKLAFTAVADSYAG